ncbi:MAG: chemotaxis protein [Luteimonas sp.]|nr:chemotaxis protein [Luteimonas sp.]
MTEAPAAGGQAVKGMTRVVLLARPGPACERLREALQQAGADLVLVADPTLSNDDEVLAAAPQAVLVALDSVVEDALERFDRVLADPRIAVIFDEAELAAQRAGWDSARWVRHLAAKLNHHHDVLPPGGETESAWHPSPGRIEQTGDRKLDLDIAPFTGEAQQLAEDVPRDPGLHLQDLSLVEDFAFDADDAPAQYVEPDAVDESVAPVVVAVAEIARPGLARDLEDLERRAATIELADVDSYGHGPKRGAVLIEAGLGGPDAVRQLLGELPEGFPRPVLVRLRLDGGRYDRLVRQMERAAKLPVTLAESGHVAEAGHVYFMPPELGLVEQAAKLVFSDAAAPSSLLDALPSSDSAVLFLSGSDPALVDVAMNSGWSGALVAGQSPDGCYDAMASTEVIARGGVSGSPTELAEQLAARWPS